MSETPILKLPELAPAQAQPEVVVNAAFRALEVVCQLRVLSRVATLPGSPANGDRYILTAADGGGLEHDVAFFSGGWKFVAPETGWKAFVVDEASDYRFLSGVWIEEAGGGGGGAYNPLVVATPLDPGVSLTFDTSGFDEDTTDIFLTPDDAGSSFQRLAATVEGHRFWLWNASAVGALGIEHDAGATDECFLCPNAEDFEIPPLGGVLILRQDDTGVQRWRVGAAATGTGGGGGGSPVFHGARISTMSYLTWTHDDRLGWDVTGIDSDTYFDQFGVDQYKLTVPAGLGGTYNVGFNLTLTNAGDGSFRRVLIKKNGSAEVLVSEENADARCIQGAGPVALAAGDYIEVFVQHDATGTVQTDPVNIGTLPCFYLYLIGT